VVIVDSDWIPGFHNVGADALGEALHSPEEIVVTELGPDPHQHSGGRALGVHPILKQLGLEAIFIESVDSDVCLVQAAVDDFGSHSPSH
jgi:hypothetical protein